MAKRDRLTEYRVPNVSRLRRRLLWRLRRLRDAVDVETLEVFEHELAAFERAGAAELERQRTRNIAVCSARVAEAQKREELIRSALERIETDILRADEAAARLDDRLHGSDPSLHNYA
ncbi:hypothetical protein LLS1_28740 [Leifsonia sp. LS1]|uniref:hypothetical protein n=1 Tax=unclassified Leifsonia TaxID=2663824 RepID=UPI001CBF185E|nr:MULTISPECIES: hypothetical protein [unclassified Leifsonia]UAJ80748.1 hypothetical protein IT072_06985 [Leifsonia sp. ZF2019]GIT81205.1 hypothetical protein LLS1_28740 [Leifsonia sp. LS1]